MVVTCLKFCVMEVRYYDIRDILGYSLIKMDPNIKKHVFWQPWLDTGIFFISLQVFFIQNSSSNYE